MIARSCVAVDPIGLPGALTGGTVGALQVLAELPCNPASSCRSCHREYTSLERALARHVGALQAGEPSSHSWVLRCRTVISGEEFPLRSGPNPTGVESYVRGDQAFVWALNRCDFSFGRVGGRLVVPREGLDLYLLDLLAR
jgi:hypothetical protein